MSALRVADTTTAGVIDAGRVTCGDAFRLARGVSAGSVVLILTSPPYWGTRTYGQPHGDDVLDAISEGADALPIPSWDWYSRRGGSLGLEPRPEWYVAHLVELFAALRPALTVGGSVWVNLGDTYFARWSSVREHGRRGLGDPARCRRRVPSGGWRHDKQLLMLPARFAIAMQEAGWILRNDVIWSKPNATPQPTRDRLASTHEHFFHFVQRTRGGRPRYHYDRSLVEPGARDVVTVATSAPRHGHPATFPAALIAPRIASSCPPKGLVLDPCCGAGTTLEVAIDLGRSALGFDVSPESVRQARLRVAAAVARCAAPTST